jgi:hypothetical protein
MLFARLQRRLFTCLFLLCIVAITVAAHAPSQAVDAITFTPPPGWTFERRPGLDHQDMSGPNCVGRIRKSQSGRCGRPDLKEPPTAFSADFFARSRNDWRP